ncbi:MAG: FAD-dependent monooxygenase, partial [Ilumatobacteraceae bacterium]
IGTQLEAEPRPVYSQDVIFDADLSAFVGDRKGSLLYTIPPEGVVIFQPLDGNRRWRCQVVVGDEHLISEAAVSERIRAALGTEDDVGIKITSMRMWQPTPGCVTKFATGRVFLAGDAAHISVPTGGMGNNTGFAGIRNLAWKLAYVVRGLASASILGTYEIEHRPIAVERIAFGVSTTDHMGRMMLGHRSGVDVSEHIQATHQYADYDHVLLGFEMTSDLIAPDLEPAPELDDPAADFTPLVRSGRRAPHVWVDAAETESVLDWFGSSYVLLLGSACSADPWRSVIAEGAGDVQVVVRQFPAGRSASPYSDDEVVLVRPDGVIAARRTIGDAVSDVADVLRYLPSSAAS